MADAKPGRGSDQFPLRLPDGMRDRIKEAAERNGRSMNAEIIDRLEWSFERASQERADFLRLIHEQDSQLQALRQKLEAPEQEIARLTKELQSEREAFLRMERLYDNTFDVAVGYRDVLATAKGQLLQYLGMVKSLASIILNLDGPPAPDLVSLAERMDAAAAETKERLTKNSTLEKAREEMRELERSIAKADDLLNPKK